VAEGSGESAVTVALAFGANLAVAVAKTVAAFITGSASMVAESAHSWADTGNETLLWIANRRGARGADARHPYGYGRETYVWSLLAAVGLFVVGAALSIWHGVTELMHETEASHENYLVAYIVLAIAFVLEGTSFLQALRQVRGEARELDRDVLEHALATSDPTTRAVFAEDAAALIGIVIALAGIALHQLTGSAAWDAIGSILVGVLLGVVAVLLIDRNRRFLTGEAGSERLRDAIVAELQRLPEVDTVRYLRLEFVGPRQLFVVASVDLIGDRVESSVAHTLRRLEHALERNPNVIEAVLTVSEPDEPARQSSQW
jgi:cation diffusion facilitator family transporter